MKKFTILFAAFALVCFAVPAMAVDWNFYGSARMAATYVSDDFDDTTNKAGTDDKDAETVWDLQGNTRFGARVKSENLKGRVEFSVSESNIGSRLLWGEWDFGSASLLVGKDYTPGASQFISTSVWTGRSEGVNGGFGADANILGIGALYGSRHGQLKLKFGGFQIALIESSTGYIGGLTATAATTTTATVGATPGVVVQTAPAAGANGDIDDYLPKIQALWGMAFDTWNFDIGAGYQTYQIEDVSYISGGATKTDDVDVDSYFVSGTAGVNLGAFTIKTALSYGQNIANAGWNAAIGSGATWDGKDDTDDVDTFMGSVVGVLRLSDMLAFEGGFGYRQDKFDVNVKEDKPKKWQTYVQAFITLAPGVYILPEIGYIDWGKSTADLDQGSTVYLASKWQIDF